MSGRPPARGSGWWRRNGVLVGGIILVVLGATVILTTPGVSMTSTSSVGWFAYAPGSNTVLLPAPPFWQQQTFLGGTIAALGFIVIAAHLGYRAGMKRAPRAPQ